MSELQHRVFAALEAAVEAGEVFTDGTYVICWTC
jgi:hypothetical protein